jgi:hypothetical protein
MFSSSLFAYRATSNGLPNGIRLENAALHQLLQLYPAVYFMNGAEDRQFGLHFPIPRNRIGGTLSPA